MEPLLSRACRREPVERTPVWFMRQAGRSLPEYRAIRKQHGLFEGCRRPELCAEVVENVGPVVEAPVRSMADAERLSVPEPEESVPSILEAVRLVREALAPE